MNPSMGGRKALASQDFYRVDSDYSKGRLPEDLQIGPLAASLSSSSDLSAALLLYITVLHLGKETPYRIAEKIMNRKSGLRFPISSSPHLSFLIPLIHNCPLLKIQEKKKGRFP